MTTMKGHLRAKRGWETRRFNRQRQLQFQRLIDQMHGRSHEVAQNLLVKHPRPVLTAIPSGLWPIQDHPPLAKTGSAYSLMIRPCSALTVYRGK